MLDVLLFDTFNKEKGNEKRQKEMQLGIVSTSAWYLIVSVFTFHRDHSFHRDPPVNKTEGKSCNLRVSCPCPVSHTQFSETDVNPWYRNSYIFWFHSSRVLQIVNKAPKNSSSLPRYDIRITKHNKNTHSKISQGTTA